MASGDEEGCCSLCCAARLDKVDGKVLVESQRIEWKSSENLLESVEILFNQIK
ncbi:MAG: hypothetical protein MHPSP_003159, partial [Paramarteilia canceri]